MKGFHWKLLTAAGVFLVLLGLGLAGYFSKSASSQPAPVPFSWPTNQSGLPPGGTPLHGAARFGNASIIASLVRSGSGVDVRDGIGGTSLHWAVSGGSVENAKTLLRLGADIDATDKLGNTPLHLVSRNDYDVIPVPPPPPWQVRLANRWPQTRKPMQWLIKHRLLPAPKPVTGPMPTTTWLDVLVEHRANVNVTNLAGETPLHLLAGRQANFGTGTSNVLHRINRLAKAGARLDAEDRQGMTPLSYATERVWLQSAPMELLLKLGANPNARTSNGVPLLLWAGTNFVGMHKAIEPLLKHGANPNAQLANGKTLLHDWGPYRRVFADRYTEMLLQHGADPSVQDNEGRAPLHVVEGWNDTYRRFAEQLMARGAKLDLQDRSGRTPIMALAAQPFGNQSTPLLRQLLDAGASRSLRDADGNTVLHYLATNTSFVHLQIEGLLRDYFATNNLINATNLAGETPLHLAMRVSNRMFSDQLARYNPDTAIRSGAGETALSIAVRTGDAALADGARPPGAQSDFFRAIYDNDLATITAWVKAAPELLRATNLTGGTPVSVASQTGLLPSLKYLIDAGAPIGLRAAVLLGRTEDLDRLLRAAQPPPSQAELDAYLHDAVHVNQPAVARLLIEAGASPSAPGEYGTSALGAARRFGRKEIVRLMESRPAQVNIFDAVTQKDHALTASLLKADPTQARAVAARGVTPLHEAAQIGNPETIQLLLDHHAPVNAEDQINGSTPLHVAVAAGRTSGVKLLLAAGASVAPVDAAGHTPLHTAALHDQFESASLLVASGANVNAQVIGVSRTRERTPYRRPSGVTPLHLAALKGSTNIVGLLLDHGADINRTNITGLTPLAAVQARTTGFPGTSYWPSSLPATQDGEIRDRMLEYLRKRGAQ